MNADLAAHLVSRLLIDALILAAPLLVTTLAIGIGVSVLQVVTQIQEMSLTFVPKVLGATLVLLVCGSWMLKYLVGVATRLISSIPSLF
jgi:flagellar biosynthetic protein FliQ